MNQRQKTISAVIATLLVGGVSYNIWAPTPRTQTMAALRDAGYGSGQGVIYIRTERLTPAARRRIQRDQPGFLRPRQRYALIARAGDCVQEDGGPAACFNAAGLAVRPGDVQVPSLRFDPAVDPEDDAGVNDGGEDEADMSEPVCREDCELVRCSMFDAGSVPIPYANGTLCGGNRMMALTPQCVIPNCWKGPGNAWDPTAVTDCKRKDPFTGVPRWMGCAPMPPEVSSGTDCLPSNCVVREGDPPDYL